MQFVEQSISPSKRALEEASESPAAKSRKVDFDQVAADAETAAAPGTPWSYTSENEEEADLTASRKVSFVADQADPLWTSRRSSTPCPPGYFQMGEATEEDDLFRDSEDMPPRVSPEQHSDHHDCATDLPTLHYTDNGHESPEQINTLFSPEPATEVAATEQPTAWDSAPTRGGIETSLTQDMDFAYLASTLHAWSPASPLPEDPKTFQQEADPKTLQEADESIAADAALLEGCDTLA